MKREGKRRKGRGGTGGSGGRREERRGKGGEFCSPNRKIVPVPMLVSIFSVPRFVFQHFWRSRYYILPVINQEWYSFALFLPLKS